MGALLANLEDRMPNTHGDTKSAKGSGKERAANRPESHKSSGRRMTREELSRHEREVRAQRWLLMGMGGLVVLVIAIVAFGWWRVYAARGSETVASVAGQSITLDTYARRLDFQRKNAEQQLQLMQAEYQANSSNASVAQLYQQQIQQLQLGLSLLPDQTLDQMIDEQLVRQEAAKRGITVSQAEIDTEIKNTFGDQPTPVPVPTGTPAPGATPAPSAAPSPSPTVGPSPTPVPTADVQARVSSFLLSSGLSQSDLRSLIESQLLYQKLQTAIGDSVPTSAEQIHARHILVATEAEANAAIARLKAGDKFADVAKAVSTDTATKDKGGDLGWFPRGVMVPEFDAVAFKLPLNQISDPVKTTYGYHIIEVLEKDPNRPIDPQMLSQLRSQAFTDWLDKARTAPDVKRELSQGQKNWVFQKIGWTPPSAGG